MIKLNRYIGRTVAGSIILVLLVIVGIDLLSALIDGLKDVRGNYTFWSVLQYVGLTAPGSFYDYLPFAALVGCLAGLGTLASSSELIVMRAAGVSTSKLVFAVIKPTLAITLLGLLVAEYVAPVSQQIAESQRAVALQKTSAIHSQHGMWHREGQQFMHFNAVQPNGVLFGVSIFRFDEERQLEENIFAERAYYTEGKWTLEAAKIVTLAPKGAQFEFIPQLPWETGLSPELLNILVLDPKDLSISGLWRYAQYLNKQGLNAGDYELAFWNKLLQPLTIMGMVLVAISFIFGPLRNVTMGFRVFVGVMVGIVFRTLQDILGPSSMVYGFDPIFASLLPICVCFLAGTYMLMKKA
ncbi:LPS export ABC transporter permease LptG [Zhongshania marina]|uniref:LPS export ABC transporter permease LptG n=1 Tax=Zhongshania marina TaxID=2304603 RepID=A0A2S4HIA6_9GAMM|nr:LPS export ABC transporter permease LptG [Marortus luteolus]POP53734.1 LPS export ABC transporter permease LptG [Marortus luteolus]RNL67743.1 LPS export ABC transporter permease LptG [Zhongshania marina]